MPRVTVFLNGQFVPEEQAVVSVFDRGFLYGDGLFETMRVFNGRIFRWEQHLARLQRGLEFLKLNVSLNPANLRDVADRLVDENQLSDSLLRLTVSRGVGKRGYSPVGADKPTVVMSVHPAPTLSAQNGWKAVISTVRLPAGEELATHKTCSKLPQILARMEADAAGADEALLLNTEDLVVEGAPQVLAVGDAAEVPVVPRVRDGRDDGDGGQVRDFVFVDDAVRALRRAMQSATSVSTSQVFNVCSGIGTSISQLGEMIARIQGVSFTPRYTLARDGDVRVSIGDPRLARDQLKFMTRTSLEQGLRWTQASIMPGHRSDAADKNLTLTAEPPVRVQAGPAP